MNVATRAQTKLLHMVLLVKLWLISSIAKSTPPIGDPKATATPAALAAVKISLVLTVSLTGGGKSNWSVTVTLGITTRLMATYDENS